MLAQQEGWHNSVCVCVYVCVSVCRQKHTWGACSSLQECACQRSTGAEWCTLSAGT